MEISEAYLQAAEILATCPRDRLPLICEYLEKAGIDIRPEKVKSLNSSWRYRSSVLKNHRTDADTSSWQETTDPVVLLMRKAYMSGISMTHLGKDVGMHRSTMYRYMKGLTPIPSVLAEQISAAICEFNPDLLPDDDDWEI